MATVLTKHQITMNFESGSYSLMEVQRILEIDDSGVYVRKDGLCQNEMESLVNKNWRRDKVLTPKLKASSYGDYCLTIGMIDAKYFESREKLDFLYAQEWRCSGRCDPDRPVTTFERISFEEALKFLTVTLSCDMDFYLGNRDEMEKDLGRKLDNLDLNNNNVMKQLEEELFYYQTIKICGVNEEDEKPAVILRDFRRLYANGNEWFATAIRGEHYFIFYYVTS